MNGNGKRFHLPAPKENYTNLLIFGSVLALIIFSLTGMYWFKDSARLATAGPALQAERVQRGQELYQAQCAGCHGGQGEGGVGMALNDQTVLKNTPDSIYYSIIRSGVPNTKMPAWSVDYGGPLTDEDVRDLVAWIRTLEQ